MLPAKFEYFRPDTLEAALSLLSAHKDEAKLIAGGQSLLSLMKLRLASPGYLIDLNGIADLSYIREQAGSDGILIGAMTTYAQILDSALLKDRCPLLGQTVRFVGDVQVRNRGTLGGSLAHADPAGDMPAAILALDAEVRTVSPRGKRSIGAREFFVSTFTTALEPDEIVSEIRVPSLPGRKSCYLKNAPRPSDYAIVGVAVCLLADRDNTCGEIAIGVTGIGDGPFRALNVEQALKGKKLERAAIDQAAALVTEGLEIAGDMHGSAEFRSYLAPIWVRRAIESVR